MARELDLNRFWGLIAEARAEAGVSGVVEDADVIAEALVNVLVALEKEEILAFEWRLSMVLRDAFRWELWGVAYLVNGGCSDDGFDYAIGWLVAQGQEHYERTLADPQHMPVGLSEDEEMECCDIWSVSARAWEQKTGDPDGFYSLDVGVSRTIQGEAWEEEEELEALYPRVFATHGW